MMLGTNASAADVDSQKCSDANSYVEQRSCLEALFKKVDSNLAKYERDVILKLSAWDEEPEYRSESKRRFTASISEFGKYRASQCDFILSLAAGGNRATDMKLDCAINLTKNRVEQLEEFTRGLGKR